MRTERKSKGWCHAKLAKAIHYSYFERAVYNVQIQIYSGYLDFFIIIFLFQGLTNCYRN